MLPDSKDLTVRAVDVPLSLLFPRLDIEDVKRRFPISEAAEPDEAIAHALHLLWKNKGEGFTELLQAYGFHEAENSTCYTGHCHVATPSLGLVLAANGFENVAFLECFRIRPGPYFSDDRCVMVPPGEEPDAAKRDEFIRIGRIPYCCLEIEIGRQEGGRAVSQKRHVSAKHTRPGEKEGLISLLDPRCHLSEPGAFPHPGDPSVSALYLTALIGADKRVVWPKKGPEDDTSELFAEYLRMNLRLE